MEEEKSAFDAEVPPPLFTTSGPLELHCSCPGTPPSNSSNADSAQVVESRVQAAVELGGSAVFSRLADEALCAPSTLAITDAAPTFQPPASSSRRDTWNGGSVAHCTTTRVPAASTSPTPTVASTAATTTTSVAATSTARAATAASPSRASDSRSSSPSRGATTSTPPPNNTGNANEAETEEEQRFVDEFGFVLNPAEQEVEAQLLRRVDGRVVERREHKWAVMAANWAHASGAMRAKLKERCRKGIPIRFRGIAWQLLMESSSAMASPENEGVYAALRAKQLAGSVDHTLSRDLARTLPNHVFYEEEGGVGQTALRNVLHAYAGIDPEVGYVQGMAFLVATLTTQMGEEEAFWIFREMMQNERHRMRELFTPGFPLLHQHFYQLQRLMGHQLPRLQARLSELGIEPSFYASQWFLTLFVYHFPFRALLHIWDIFMCEGWKIVYRVGLALLQWEEAYLLAAPYEDVLARLKNVQEGKDTKTLLERAHRIKFKTADLIRYGQEYAAGAGQ